MTTATFQSHVIVSFGSSPFAPDACAHAHHHEFPDLDAEGESVREAVVNLAAVLDRAHGFATHDYNRRALERALDEVRQFLDASP